MTTITIFRPHLWCAHGLWHCRLRYINDPGVFRTGIGDTPMAAYLNWFWKQ